MEFDIHDAANWTLPQVLAHQAAVRGDQIACRMVQGDALSYRDLYRDSLLVAGWLNGLGYGPGDRVVVMLPSGLDYLRLWAGIARLGAVMVSLNTELNGAMLESQLQRSQARLAITGGKCAGPLVAAAAQVPGLEQIVSVEDMALAPLASSVAQPSYADWRDARAYDGPSPQPADIAMILYTSGTTGPAKGVLLPHAHCYVYALGMIDSCKLTPRDCYYVVLPLYHVNGLFMQVYATLLAGGCVALRERFSLSAWLGDIRTHGATMTGVVGAITSLVFSQPPSPEEKDHKLRLVMPGPNLAEQEKVWKTRFAVPEVVSCYGMTECNMPIWGRIGETRPGSVGKVYAPYFEARIADPDSDRTLPAGQPGEILVRPCEPFAFMQGYDGMPEKTVEATRNLWFHTGDAGYCDADGYFFFIDRMGDRIRRRGENISSFDVEEALERVLGVREAAAYAIASDIDDGEDELMAAVVLDPAAGIDLPAIAAQLPDLLPRFSCPRYLVALEELPRTRTHKIQKAVLRERGICPQTFDTVKSAFLG